jgi:hypothetical protein
MVQFGRTSDGAHPDGYYSVNGIVSNQNMATVVAVKGSNVAGINVQLPFVAGLH